MAEEEILWPLRAVSTDPTNLTTLDADGNILTSSTATDGRYVLKAGDTMTGPLTVQGDNAEAAFIVAAYSDAGNAAVRFRRTRGTLAAPATLLPNDYIGRLTYAASDAGGTFRTSAFSCQVVSVAATGVETQFNFILTTSAGATLTPLLVTKDGISVSGNITSTGTAHTFAQGSIPSIAWGPMVLLTEATTTGTIDRTDAGKILVAAPPVNQDFTMTLPTAGTAGIVSGMVVELVSNITSAGKYYIIQAPAGVSLFYNSTLGGSGDGTLGGGVAAKVRLRGPMTSIRLLCVDSATWWAFGDLVPL
jgi:hypothetical protein